MMMKSLGNWMTEPKLLRERIRQKQWRQSTSGICPGFVQANLVVLPNAHAAHFRAFCENNPKACPLLEVTAPGDPFVKELADAADLRMDLPAYRIFEKGVCVAEVEDLLELWRDDLVAFLLGCSHTFDAILHQHGFFIRHFVEHKTPPFFITKRACAPAGIFAGPLVVSGRAIPAERVQEVVRLTARYPLAHGAPIHVGKPEQLGIHDLSRSADGGSGLELKASEVPVFWACGVTPQAVALAAKIPFMATHKPGHMFVGDLSIESICCD
jgi:uncharacterized protein YcsI (UPF0317 family)